jgi:hypothetical protein
VTLRVLPERKDLSDSERAAEHEGSATALHLHARHDPSLGRALVGVMRQLVGDGPANPFQDGDRDEAYKDRRVFAGERGQRANADAGRSADGCAEQRDAIVSSTAGGTTCGPNAQGRRGRSGPCCCRDEGGRADAAEVRALAPKFQGKGGCHDQHHAGRCACKASERQGKTQARTFDGQWRVEGRELFVVLGVSVSSEGKGEAQGESTEDRLFHVLS